MPVVTQYELMTINTYFAFNEKQYQIANPRCVFAAFLSLQRPQIPRGVIEFVCKQFGIQKLASSLSHAAM